MKVVARAALLRCYIFFAQVLREFVTECEMILSLKSSCARCALALLHVICASFARVCHRMGDGIALKSSCARCALALLHVFCASFARVCHGMRDGIVF